MIFYRVVILACPLLGGLSSFRSLLGGFTLVNAFKFFRSRNNLCMRQPSMPALNGDGEEEGEGEGYISQTSPQQSEEEGAELQGEEVESSSETERGVEPDVEGAESTEGVGAVVEGAESMEEVEPATEGAGPTIKGVESTAEGVGSTAEGVEPAVEGAESAGGGVGVATSGGTVGHVFTRLESVSDDVRSSPGFQFLTRADLYKFAKVSITWAVVPEHSEGTTTGPEGTTTWPEGTTTGPEGQSKCISI